MSGGEPIEDVDDERDPGDVGFDGARVRPGVRPNELGLDDYGNIQYCNFGVSSLKNTYF